MNFLGPIFEKELRTSARHRRIFFLRSLYVVAIALAVGLFWYGEVGHKHGQSGLDALAGSNQLGIQLLCTIGVVQFIALQIISPVLTSTAISDEINRGTLGSLMMTPITGFQIVMGKLFSKLLTLLLLVSTSLPLLAVMRVFGGIEWNLVLSLVGLTLCAAVFAAALGLVFSIYHKKAFPAIFMTYVTLLGIYLLVPLLAGGGFSGNFNGLNRMAQFAYFNPFTSLAWLVEKAQNPGIMLTRSTVMIHPLCQCILLLLATLMLVTFAAFIVRRVALRLAAGEPVLMSAKAIPPVVTPVTEIIHLETIRPVGNDPVLWREIHTPFMGTRNRRLFIILFTVGAFGLTYLHTWPNIRHEYTHVLYTETFLLMTLIVAAVLPAVTITGEKEASTWEILLATPLSARRIVAGKVKGALQRIVPLSVFFFGHGILFTLLGYIHPLALIHMALVISGPVVFLVGSGVYISSRLKHTTNAVLVNIVAGLILWLGLPFLAAMLDEVLRMGQEITEAVLSANPMILNGLVMDALGGAAVRRDSIFVFSICGGKTTWFPFTLHLFGVTVCYFTLGAVFYGLAVRSVARFRS